MTRQVADLDKGQLAGAAVGPCQRLPLRAWGPCSASTKRSMGADALSARIGLGGGCQDGLSTSAYRNGGAKRSRDICDSPREDRTMTSSSCKRSPNCIEAKLYSLLQKLPQPARREWLTERFSEEQRLALERWILAQRTSRQQAATHELPQRIHALKAKQHINAVSKGAAARTSRCLLSPRHAPPRSGIRGIESISRKGRLLYRAGACAGPFRISTNYSSDLSSIHRLLPVIQRIAERVRVACRMRKAAVALDDGLALSQGQCATMYPSADAVEAPAFELRGVSRFEVHGAKPPLGHIAILPAAPCDTAATAPAASGSPAEAMDPPAATAAVEALFRAALIQEPEAAGLKGESASLPLRFFAVVGATRLQGRSAPLKTPCLPAKGDALERGLAAWRRLDAASARLRRGPRCPRAAGPEQLRAGWEQLRRAYLDAWTGASGSCSPRALERVRRVEAAKCTRARQLTAKFPALHGEHSRGSSVDRRIRQLLSRWP